MDNINAKQDVLIFFKWLVVSVMLFMTQVYAVDTVRDDFTTVSYSNNDGTQLWTSDWIESENNGPSSGVTFITGGR